MAPSEPLLYILFTVGFLSKYSNTYLHAEHNSNVVLICQLDRLDPVTFHKKEMTATDIFFLSGISQIEVGVNFLEEPRDVIGARGKSLALPCKPARTNLLKDFLEIKWYHNNRLIDLTNDKRRTILPNGTLHFSKLIHKKAGHSDQGEYRCVIAKKNGSLSSRPGFLRISVLPESFSRHPLEQIVEIGSNVRLSCEIDLFSELKIEWEKDNQKLPQNDLKYLTVTGSGVHGSILYIFNAVPEDSGSYRCTAKNILLNKQRFSSSGLVTVLSRMRESSPSQNSLTFLSAQRPLSSSFFSSVREIKEGDNVTLDCVANGSPTPILIWNFVPLGQNNPLFVFNKTNTGYNILHIKNITRHQAGGYTCTAMNSSKREITTTVQVMTAPEIQEKSESIVFRASKTVRFRCKASGNPLPDFYWLKDGDLFNITGRIKHRTSVNESQQLRLSELILYSTVTSDAGIYQCMANNSVGSTWAASRLLLNATKPAPSAPEKVFCETLSSSQIKLTWDVPSITDKIIAFSVHYHLTDYGEEMQKVLAGNSRSTQIDKLLPFTNYTFYVRLYIDSASEFSQETICQTGEEVPIEAPKLKLKIASPNSVHLSWVPLPKEKARGIVDQYKIQWRIAGSPSSRIEEVTSDVTDYTITGLIPGKNYEIRVLAATRKGWPDTDLPWQTLEVPLIYNSNLPSAPEVKLQAINSSTIEVKWNLPKRSAHVQGYKVFYRKHNSKQLGPVTIPSEVKEYVITGLDPETWYEVMVLGFTSVNDGETGINSIHTLSKEGSSNQLSLAFPSIPEPPVSLEADPVSPVAINLSWSSPQVSSESSKINYYTVCFNSVQTSRNKNVTATCLKSSDTKILIVGLNPFTLYEFKVKSHEINNKQSAFSRAIECHTLEDVPSPVMDINWKALNKTTVQISWKKPIQSNGIIRNYTLSYTQDVNLPLNLWKVKVVPATSLKTELTDLISNVKYYLLVRASTGAGVGSYISPKQFLIPSPTGAAQEESTSTTPKDKQSDHYIGIMVGLGIGLCCIILCTTCILCRRRCLKSHISQEFEVTSAHYSNGNDCRPDGEVVRDRHEAEYFTFLCTQRDRLNSVEVTLQQLDTKGRCPNGSPNGIRMSLLSEGRTSNDSGKANIRITENPRCDPYCSESPLLSLRTHSNSVDLGSDASEQFKVLENRRSGSRPHRWGKPKSSDMKVLESEVLCNNNNFELENFKSGRKVSASDHKLRFASQNNRDIQSSIDGNETEKLSKNEQWLNLNNVLKNPDFRFSDSNSETLIKMLNGFAFPGHFYNSVIDQNRLKEKGIINASEDPTVPSANGVCAPSKVSLIPTPEK